ncbi:MAG: hypothetical protein OER87_19280 [Gammaproteobacteria bacterium]|nr:hypothetical protein [Gammaproteobacteria bacterium]
MVGPTNVELAGTFLGFSAASDDSDTGLGFQFANNADGVFAIDYINYYDKDGADVGSANLSFSGYF